MKGEVGGTSPSLAQPLAPRVERWLTPGVGAPGSGCDTQAMRLPSSAALAPLVPTNELRLKRLGFPSLPDFGQRYRLRFARALGDGVTIS